MDLYHIGCQQEKVIAKWRSELHDLLDEFTGILKVSEMAYVQESLLYQLKVLHQDLGGTNQFRVEQEADSGQKELWGMINFFEHMVSNPEYLPNDIYQAYRQRRIEMIRMAINRRAPIERDILEQYPAETFRKDLCRAGYFRAKWSSACVNILEGLDDRLLESYGVLIRRQDGRTVTQEQANDIRTFLDEIRNAIGDITSICRATHLIIIDTLGKHIYRTSQMTYGIYDPEKRAIVACLESSRVLGIGILAHEIGHWLDYVCVPSADWFAQNVVGILYHPRALPMSFIDSFLNPTPFIQKAVQVMKPYNKIQKAIGKKFLMPSEVWARLVSQYVTRTYERKYPHVVKRPFAANQSEYQGHWAEHEWERWLEAEVRQQLDARIQLASQVYQVEKDDWSESNIKHAFPYDKLWKRH